MIQDRAYSVETIERNTDDILEPKKEKVEEEKGKEQYASFFELFRYAQRT